VSVPRPWRAIAYRVPPTHEVEGRRRKVVGRTAASSPAGLERFVNAHKANGDEVDVFEVLDLLDEIPPET
jgi:hypothetical protein